VSPLTNLVFFSELSKKKKTMDDLNAKKIY